jgi:DNA-binding MarR family transcriptional regulator
VAAIVQGLRRITQAVEEYSREVYRAYGLTGPQLWALKTLHHQGAMTAGELAEALVVHQSSVSVLVARLERRRLVRRVRRRTDRRYV